MEHLLRLGIVITIVLLGIVANLVVMAGLWSLRQIQTSSLTVRRFSRVPPHVLDRLLGATTLAAALLAVVAAVSQLPVHAFGKSRSRAFSRTARFMCRLYLTYKNGVVKLFIQ
jgi:hypothetical protein